MKLFKHGLEWRVVLPGPELEAALVAHAIDNILPVFSAKCVLAAAGGGVSGGSGLERAWIAEALEMLRYFMRTVPKTWHKAAGPSSMLSRWVSNMDGIAQSILQQWGLLMKHAVGMPC